MVRSQSCSARLLASMISSIQNNQSFHHQYTLKLTIFKSQKAQEILPTHIHASSLNITHKLTSYPTTNLPITTSFPSNIPLQKISHHSQNTCNTRRHLDRRRGTGEQRWAGSVHASSGWDRDATSASRSSGVRRSRNSRDGRLARGLSDGDGNDDARVRGQRQSARDDDVGSRGDGGFGIVSHSPYSRICMGRLLTRSLNRRSRTRRRGSRSLACGLRCRRLTGGGRTRRRDRNRDTSGSADTLKRRNHLRLIGGAARLLHTGRDRGR